jgi:molybdate transport system substrate-binding protein
MSFGASGLPKNRIVAVESPHVFASANMAHPGALVAAGKAPAATAFASNALCVLAAPAFDLRCKTLALRLLDLDVRVGMSTAKADPSGD